MTLSASILVLLVSDCFVQPRFERPGYPRPGELDVPLNVSIGQYSRGELRNSNGPVETRTTDDSFVIPVSPLEPNSIYEYIPENQYEREIVFKTGETQDLIAPVFTEEPTIEQLEAPENQFADECARPGVIQITSTLDDPDSAPSSFRAIICGAGHCSVIGETEFIMGEVVTKLEGSCEGIVAEDWGLRYIDPAGNRTESFKYRCSSTGCAQAAHSGTFQQLYLVLLLLFFKRRKNLTTRWT